MIHRCGGCNDGLQSEEGDKELCTVVPFFQGPKRNPKEGNSTHTTCRNKQRSKTRREQQHKTESTHQREREREKGMRHTRGTKTCKEVASTLPFSCVKRRSGGFQARGEGVIRRWSSIREFPHLRDPKPSVASSVQVVKHKDQFSRVGFK